MNRKILLLIITCSLVAFALAGWTWDDGNTLASAFGW